MDEHTESDDITTEEPVRKPRRGRIDILAPLAFLLPLYIFWKTLCPVLFYGDSGELITAAQVGGLAFPTGYPAYLISLLIFIRIPLDWLMPQLQTIDTLAWQANFLSALFGATACYILFHLLKRLTRSPLAALGGSLIFAFSKTFWQQSLIAEVYSLNALLCVSILFLDLRLWEEKRSRYVVIRWLIQGIALANHPMALFFIPLGLYTTTLYLIRTADKRKLKTILKALLALALGLALYLYLPIASSFDPPLDYENPENLKNFWNVVSRSTYSAGFSQWQWGEGGVRLPGLANAYIKWSLDNLGFFIHILAIAGLIGIFRIRDGYRGLRIGILFTSLLLLGFFWIYYIGVAVYDLQYMEVYYIPNHMILVILAVIGMCFLTQVTFNNRGKYDTKFSLLAGMILLLAAGGVCIMNYARADRSQNLIAHYYLEDIARTLPDGEKNILITEGDDIFLFWYLKYAKGSLPNTVLIGRDTFFSQNNWYWDSIRRENPDMKIPDPIEIAGSSGGDKTLADKLFLLELYHSNSDRYRLMFTQYSQDLRLESIDQSVVPYQRGLIVEMVPNGTQGEGIFLDEELLTGYNLREIINLDVDSLDFYEKDIFNRYAIPVYSYGKFLVKTGELERGIELYSDARHFLNGIDDIEFTAMIKNDIGLGYLDAARAAQDEEVKAEHYSDALEIFMELADMIPEKAIYHAHLARLYFFFGDMDKAQAELTIAIFLDPENPLLQELRGLVQDDQDEENVFVFD